MELYFLVGGNGRFSGSIVTMSTFDSDGIAKKSESFRISDCVKVFREWFGVDDHRCWREKDWLDFSWNGSLRPRIQGNLVVWDPEPIEYLGRLREVFPNTWRLQLTKNTWNALHPIPAQSIWDRFVHECLGWTESGPYSYLDRSGTDRLKGEVLSRSMEGRMLLGLVRAGWTMVKKDELLCIVPICVPELERDNIPPSFTGDDEHELLMNACVFLNLRLEA